MSKEKTRKSRFKLFLACCVFVITIIIAIYLGTYFIRTKEAEKIVNVLGIDVSAYQGNIDWTEVEDQGIYFAYIKATESTDYLDARFKENWENIDSTSIRKGAYLFFDFKADAAKQAEYFIENVPKERNALPPVIDVELVNEAGAPPVTNVKKSIETIINKLEDNYNKTPFIYTNLSTYEKYIKNNFDDISVWICDLDASEPGLDSHDWVFWQYSWRGILNGIGDRRQFVDLDVYNGNLKQFNEEFDSGIF